MFSATQIVPGLWQGEFPPPGSNLRMLGFDVLVLCAQELQPPARSYPDVRVVRAPMDDSFAVPVELAHGTARNVARVLNANKRVLVTCAMGLNRSGLVSALALWYTRNWSGERCVARVQAQRAGALCNSAFARYVRSLPPREAPTRSVFAAF